MQRISSLTQSRDLAIRWLEMFVTKNSQTIKAVQADYYSKLRNLSFYSFYNHLRLLLTFPESYYYYDLYKNSNIPFHITEVIEYARISI